MKHVGCFLIAVVVMISVIWTSACLTLWEQIKELCRDKGTTVVAGDTFLSVITNRLDSITVITYTLKGEDK